jgi:hypothetical protein
VDTPAAPLSSIILWKVILEYRLSNVKAEVGTLFGLLKTSILVIVYNMDWLFRSIIVFVLSISSNSVRYW